MPLRDDVRDALARNFILKANVLYSGYPISVYTRVVRTP